MNLVLIKFLNSQYPWLRLALPRAQVCTRDALFFDPAVLSRNRVGKSGFKFFLRSQTGVVLVGVQSAKVIDQWDDGVNLPFFLCKHRFPLGEYANAFNTVFGFGGGDLQGGLLMNGYFAKCVQGVETYGSGPMMFEPCVASWEDFVGASHASEKPVVHKRLIASRASAHKVQV
jgi:hypothetical protein